MNKTNIFYVLVLLFLIAATAVELFTDKPWVRYYYSTMVTAPDTYPVSLQDVHFILADGTISDLDDDDIRGWGESANLSDKAAERRLPEKLILSYLSYRDQLFYTDTISLPAATLDSIFKNLVKTNDGNPVHNSSAGINLSLNIVVGIANKGNIIVWLHGHNYEHTLLKHQIFADKKRSVSSFPVNGKVKQLYLDKLSNKELKEAILSDKDADAEYIDTPSFYRRHR